MIRFISLTVPECLMTDQTFSPSERLIGFYVFANPDRIIPAEIVRAFQMSKNTVTKALGKFVKAGVLTRGSRFGDWKLSSEYAEQANPSNWEMNPSNREMNPNMGEMNPSNREMNPIFRDSEPQREEETETEQESKKERSKERSKEKEREKEEEPKNSTDPYGSVLSEVRGGADKPVVIDPLSASELLPTGDGAVAPCPYQAIQNMFNRICVSYPHIKGIDGKRRQLVSGRWTSYPNLDVFREVFENAENSSFMKGQSKSGWTADFDWMMKPSNFQKVLEGNYNDRAQTYGRGAVPDKDPFAAYLDAVIAGEA